MVESKKSLKMLHGLNTVIKIKFSNEYQKIYNGQFIVSNNLITARAEMAA
jgi:hypothetical protein